MPTVTQGIAYNIGIAHLKELIATPGVMSVAIVQQTPVVEEKTAGGESERLAE